MSFEEKMEKILENQGEIMRHLAEMKEKVGTDEQIWDIADVLCNWPISRRSVMSWKRKGLIGYTQVGGKIYFTPEDRRKFLEKYHVEPNNGGIENNG